MEYVEDLLKKFKKRRKGLENLEFYIEEEGGVEVVIVFDRENNMVKEVLDIEEHVAFSEKICAYVDSCLNKREREEFERHLIGCEYCSLQVAEFYEVIKMKEQNLENF